ncbi:MAG: VOC family protein [Taibaiella sp.]|nr:VOC family protein [Taibaiella sp.]
MAQVNIPEGYQSVIPYLIVKDASSFISFTKEVFDAEEINRHMRDEQIIMHAELRVYDSIIMLAEATDTYSIQNSGMFIYVPDADEAYHKGIRAGATPITPMSDQNYGRTGGIKDPFGNTWWVTSVK